MAISVKYIGGSECPREIAFDDYTIFETDLEGVVVIPEDLAERLLENPEWIRNGKSE